MTQKSKRKFCAGLLSVARWIGELNIFRLTIWGLRMNFFQVTIGGRNFPTLTPLQMHLKTAWIKVAEVLLIRQKLKASCAKFRFCVTSSEGKGNKWKWGVIPTFFHLRWFRRETSKFPFNSNFQFQFHSFPFIFSLPLSLKKLHISCTT